MVNDFDDFDKAGSEIHFDGGGPVTPFQQLMSVLPASSGIKLLPKVFAPLFTSPSSPVKQYYPQRFDVDIDGVKVPWGGTTLINFVDEDILFKAMDEAVAKADRTGNNALTPEEKERNREGSAHVYRFDPSVEPVEVRSTVPRFLPDLDHVTVDVNTFHHAPLPAGMEYFPHWVLPACDTKKYVDCWPSLQTKKVVVRYAVGVKIFNFASQRESMFLGVQQSFDELVRDLCESMLKAYVVQVDYPCVHKARVVAVRFMTEGGKVMRCTRNKVQKSAPASVYRTDINNELDYYERHGILFNFTTCEGDRLSEDVMESEQPILEVQRVTAHHVDEAGRRVYDFSTVTERRLASLCRVLEREPVKVEEGRGRRDLAVGDRVMVDDRGGKHAGCVGRITRILPGAVEMDTEQPLGWSVAAVTSSVEKVLRDGNDLKWYSPEVAASKADLTLELWWRIVGSITAKLGRERVQVGMELFHWTRFEVSPGQSGFKMLVVPNYTRHSYIRETKQEYWSFSSYAVLAVKEYIAAFPSVFDGLCELDNTDTNLSVSAKRLLQGDDYEYELAKLNRWLGNQEFRRLPLVSPKYTALSRMGVQFLEGLTDYYIKSEATQPLPHITVASHHLVLADSHAKLGVKSKKSRPEVGSRAVYINGEGSAPVGARCTVTGVFGRWGEQDMKVELLFDKPTFGCGTAYGRCSSMRGMVAPAADVMILPLPAGEPVSPAPAQSIVKSYSSPPPVKSSLKNGRGKGRRRSKKAPSVTYASRHPDSMALSRELRHMLGIPSTKKETGGGDGGV
ncbi:hypothetical protein FOL47_007602 [Perkinsus chesapeaki]|uniref:Uncharacterized protein n=1 Tax=Perkinsus chesapeaki TaxID=330153 RepID=A0A7J6LJU1_PERCH|nr:hypothetical protein FOL47_007602 [Perkinsus chesapeaki]